MLSKEDQLKNVRRLIDTKEGQLRSLTWVKKVVDKAVTNEFRELGWLKADERELSK